MLQTPDFWQAGSNSPLPLLLSPLACLYGLAQRANRWRSRPQDIGVPVISIGNLVAGGAGKTPAALALAPILSELGYRCGFITRGYGGTEHGPLRVDPLHHSAVMVGDESLLLARRAPTWVGRDRVAAGRAAAAAGCTLVLADDAHQTHGLARRVNLLVVDAGYGFGNGRLLPSGPLRESLREGLSRADAVLRIGPGSGAPLDFSGLPVFHAELTPHEEDARQLAGTRLYAFAGIGRPAKFYESLRGLGAEIAGQRDFPDHAIYAPETIMELVETAHRLNATPVTTEKDLMRFPPEARPMVKTLRVYLQFKAPDTLGAFLQGRLRNG